MSPQSVHVIPAGCGIEAGTLRGFSRPLLQPGDRPCGVGGHLGPAGLCRPEARARGFGTKPASLGAATWYKHCKGVFFAVAEDGLDLSL